MYFVFSMFLKMKNIENQTCFTVFLVFENKKYFSKTVTKNAHSFYDYAWLLVFVGFWVVCIFVSSF